MIIEPSIIKNIVEIVSVSENHLFKRDRKIIIKFNNVIIFTKSLDGNSLAIAKIINQDYVSSCNIVTDKLQNVLNRGLTLIINDNKPIANFRKVGGQAVLGRQNISPTPWLTERNG